MIVRSALLCAAEFVLYKCRVGKNERQWYDDALDITDYGIHWSDEGV